MREGENLKENPQRGLKNMSEYIVTFKNVLTYRTPAFVDFLDDEDDGADRVMFNRALKLFENLAEFGHTVMYYHRMGEDPVVLFDSDLFMEDLA